MPSKQKRDDMVKTLSKLQGPDKFYRHKGERQCSLWVNKKELASYTEIAFCCSNY